MALPKIAIVPTGGTIQNSQPFVTSTKAGGPHNVLRPQRLHDSVIVHIAKEDVDGNPLPITNGEEPYWEATLEPKDGLYLLPYLDPGHEPPEIYSGVRIGVERLIEEINRFGLDTMGRNGLLNGSAELVIKQVVDPRTGEELRAGGETFSMYELSLIANTVNGALAERGIAGCIVTHGTFTAEETACFLHYAVNSNKPVVICGSQRRHTSMGNDGDWNLVDGVRVAIDPQSRSKGVVLVMNEQIFPAREVTKTNQRPDGFQSSGGSGGALGSVESDQVSYYYQPTRKHTSTSDVRATKSLPPILPRVDILKTYAGADSYLVDALIDQALQERADPNAPDAHGIVVEGFAFSAMPHRFQRPALERAVRQYGIPVALANRGDRGRAPHLPIDEFITCDNLMAVKARLLLTLAIHKLGMLTPHKDPDNPTQEERERLRAEVGRYQEIFDTH